MGVAVEGSGPEQTYEERPASAGETPMVVSRASRRPQSRWYADPLNVGAALVVLAAVVVGLWLRYRYYTVVEPGPDSDEAEFALLADQLLRGEVPIVMRGQPYGGTPWLIAIAVSIRAFGMNVFGLRLPTVVLGITNVALIFAIGRQLGWSVRRAALGAGSIWCYPMATVFFASRETMYFVPAVTCSLVTLLLVLRLEAQRDPTVEHLGATSWSRRLLFLAGLAAGVGLWINPGSLYISGPTLLWLGVRSAREAYATTESWGRRAWLAARPGTAAGVGLVVGASPLLFVNLVGYDRRNNYSDRIGYSLVERLELLARQQAPGWLGFKVPLGGYTEGAWLGGAVWKLAFLALALLFVFQTVRRSSVRNESVVTFLALACPFVFLLVTAQSGPIYANLRYIFFASPILSLLIVAKWRREWLAVAAAATLPLVSAAGVLAWQVNQGETVESTVELLEARGATCAIGDYWAGGYRVMFHSEGKIATAMTYENRDPVFLEQAEDRGNCPWIFKDGDPYANLLLGYLDAQGIGVEVQRPGAGLVVFFPDQRVWLTDVFPDAVPAN